MGSPGKKRTRTQGRVVGTKKATPTAGGPPNPDAMSPEVVEFIQAVDEYKRVNDRKFPTLSELFDILRELGYHR